MPTKKKKRYNSRFPPARIKKIMQSDEDVGKVAAAVPVIISRALELFVETLLGNVNQAISNRGARTMTPSHLKMCIHAEPRFDFLKDLVSEVPELQGDTDERESLGSDNCGAAPSPSTSSAPSSKNTSGGSSRPSKVQRQLSTSRPRGRPRKASTDASKPKLSTRRFVEVESSESETQIVDSDEEEVSPLEIVAASNSSRLHPAIFAHSQSLPSSPQVLTAGENPLNFTIQPMESLRAPPPPFQRSQSCYPSVNGHHREENGISGEVKPVFTITIPPLVMQPSATNGKNDYRSVSTSGNSSSSNPSTSVSNGLFSVSRLVDAEGSTPLQSSVPPYQPLASSYADDVDEDYDA